MANQPPVHSSFTKSCIYEFIHSSFMHLCIQPSIYPSICHPGTHLPIHLSIHPPICPSSRCPFFQSPIHTSSMNSFSIHSTIHLVNNEFFHHPSPITPICGEHCDLLLRSLCNEGLVALTSRSACVNIL
ncbi:hypothetical protein HJG60_011375 [Phyllostomus discolor]|uniref:Uncharacterized protein n=1 Tax=Phyllostomus discolor TaxID=89673 RepID=A0A834A2K1_9CHIR|nr:hypothetical protein HJG60_011375 [Phyllostomus discolor]